MRIARRARIDDRTLEEIVTRGGSWGTPSEAPAHLHLHLPASPRLRRGFRVVLADDLDWHPQELADFLNSTNPIRYYDEITR